MSALPSLVCEGCRCSINIIDSDCNIEEFERRLSQLEAEAQDNSILFPLCPVCFEIQNAYLAERSRRLETKINFVQLKGKEYVEQVEALPEMNLKELIRVCEIVFFYFL
jgi:hypothetical protein